MNKTARPMFYLYEDRKNTTLLAKGYYIGQTANSTYDNEMIVLKGAIIANPHRLTKTQCLKKRAEVLGNAEYEDDTFILREDVTFSSPSLAAAVILGKEVNGKILWKHELGHTLGDWLKGNVGKLPNVEKKPKVTNQAKTKQSNYDYDAGTLLEIKRILSIPHDHWFKKSREDTRITKIEAADLLIRDLENYPEAFFIGCLMDRQIKAERAWTVPLIILEHFGTLDMSVLGGVALSEWTQFFIKKSIHRHNNVMSNVLYEAIKRINNDYNGDVQRIWSGESEASVIVKRFLEFKGLGPKIATMAVNILYRDFKLPITDLSAIDISPDVQVMKVFYRLGLINSRSDTTQVITKARTMHSDFPGIFDLGAWEIGRAYCHESNPSCGQCPLNQYCAKIGINFQQETSTTYEW